MPAVCFGPHPYHVLEKWHTLMLVHLCMLDIFGHGCSCMPNLRVLSLTVENPAVRIVGMRDVRHHLFGMHKRWMRCLAACSHATSAMKQRSAC